MVWRPVMVGYKEWRNLERFDGFGLSDAVSLCFNIDI